MANNLKGITLEIGGDTTQLSSALRSVNSEIRNTQSELKEVDKLLKLDPTNTELLEQRQQLLKKAVEETTDKLSKLKDAQEQMDAAGVDHNTEQYQALQREIIATENSLNDLSEQADKASVSVAKISGAFEECAASCENIAEKTKGISTAAAAGIAGVVALGTASVNAYSDYEQLVGGVETLFKDSAQTVQKYASDAYKTSGLSANQYMETVTSFSAALISSLGNDTAAAAQYADIAITDMSDNANKMGTDMSAIQNAYQGFAKGNYTMLDNLKLGYGGTKKEMERLLATADTINARLGYTTNYSIESFADIVDAIHVVQTEMDITGTTAAEAEKTIQGSIATLKAAWQNLLTGMGVAGADVDELANRVIQAANNVWKNVSVVIQNIWNNIPTGAKIGIIVMGIVAAVSPIFSLIANISKSISTLIPVLSSLYTTIMANPTVAIIAAATIAIVALVYLIIKYIDEIQAAFDAAGNFLVEKAGWIKDGILTAVNALVDGVKIAFGLMYSMIRAVVNTIIQMVETAINRVISGINSVISAFNRVVSAVASVVGATYSGISKIQSVRLPKMATGGILSGGSAIVGEAGPELLTMLGNKAMIQPLTATLDAGSVQALTSSQKIGGGTQSISIEFTGSLAQLGRVLYPVLKTEGQRHEITAFS